MTGNLSTARLVVATHIYATGPALDFRDYLNGLSVSDLLFISHPLFYSDTLRGSGCQVYHSGRLVLQTFRQHKKFPDLLTYFLHPLLTIWYVINTQKRWQLFVGSDNLNAVCGLLLKLLGRVDKCVYYVIDYNPHRFSSKLLNSVYHFLDQVCVRYCDETWNLSPRMKTARQRYFKFTGGRQKTVPLGIWYDRINDLAKNQKYNPRLLVYVGQIAQKQGIHRVIDALPGVVSKIPDFKFLVIGGGDYLPVLRKQVARLNLDKYVEFTGFVTDHRQIEKMLSRGALAVAMYEKLVDGHPSFTYFTDPGKVKLYLASGLPVLISDVPYNAPIIQRKKCGLIIADDTDSITDAILKMLSDPKKLADYKSNARKYAQSFDWNIIFARALNSFY